MKLANALMDRADMQTKLQMINERILNNLKVQEGQDLIEDPNQLIEEYEQIKLQLISLIQRINRTNANTEIKDYGITIADGLAKKEQLLSLKHTFDEIINSATHYQTRISRTEIKYINVVDVKVLQKKSDDIAKEYRLLDAKIQELNWLTELE